MPETSPPVPTRKSGWLGGIAILVFLLLLTSLTVYLTSPPNAVPKSAPATEFSSERALEHLKVISSEIHPSGSPGQAKVRDYLVSEIRAMGLEPEVQKTTSIYSLDKLATFDKAATVENVAVRLPGTKGTQSGGEKAILLVAHYDSSISSYGANRNGSAVSAYLETMRALKAGPQLTNDVIFLFTDAEEAYLMGAKAFMDEHPWAKDVGVVFNFDARGSSGPAMMFETSEQNGQLIEAFAKASPHPLANSLLYSVYKLMPYASDLSIFKEQGIAGLNFAYANDVQNYHSTLDSYESVDERSLQHVGSYALALAQYFGNHKLPDATGSDDVFFNLGNRMLISYSTAWVWPLTALITLLLIYVAVLGRRQKQMTGKGILFGTLAFFLTLLAAGVVITGLFLLIGLLTDPFALTRYDEVLTVGLAAVTLALIAGLMALFRKKTALPNLVFGASIWWWVLTVITSAVLPSGSYLFAWPLLFSLLTTWYLLKAKEPDSLRARLIICLLAIPALLLVGHVIYILFIMLGLTLPAVEAVLITLLLGLLLPHVQIMSTREVRLLPVAVAVLGLGFLAYGTLSPAYSAESPKPNSLMYGLDADAGKGYWGSVDTTLDPFTSQYLTGAKKSDFSKFYPLGLGAEVFLEKEGPKATVDLPKVQVLSDTEAGGIRTLKLHISSTANPFYTLLTFQSDQPLEKLQINGKPMKNHDSIPTRWEVYYYAPHEGFDLALEAKPKQKINLRVVNALEGFPAELEVKRPDTMAPTYYSDITFVSKTFEF